ncbi:uncharacterized protein [Chironomus tepperi]|uniref:uncharacterized protein isoform X3 n=1 Tax=Chironomus tepperi TaxID=113505 RepID=UPI00391F5425
MKGKGFSSCLMCESQNDLILGNQLILRIIQARYETDIFDVMLQNTKMCPKCIGRFQQLNEFCAIVEIAASDNHSPDNDKINCGMCHYQYSPYEIMPSSNTVDSVKWLKKCEGDKVISCYSCYNFTLLYNEKKEELNNLLDYFHHALNNCKVIVKDCGQNADLHDDSVNYEQEQFFGTLSLTPVANNRSIQKRVSFAPDEEIIPQPQKKKVMVTRRSSSVTPTPLVETASCENINSVNNKTPKHQTRKFRNSIGSVPRVVNPTLLKAHPSRFSTGSSEYASNFEALKREHNIVECFVLLQRLSVFPSEEVEDDLKNKVTKVSAKKKQIKIKLNAKSKVMSRRINRSLTSERKNKADELENSLNLEIVLTEDNLNNSQSSTLSADPLDANNEEGHNDSTSLDDTLPIINHEHSTENVVQIRDEDNNNQVSLKENNDVIECSTRKTRNSTGKLTESTNVPESQRVRKRKTNVHLLSCKSIKKQKSPTSQKKKLEDLESKINENIKIEAEDVIEEYLSSAVKFESTTNYNEEMDLLSTSQENFVSLSSEDLNMNNVEYLEESLEEIMNTRLSPKNDVSYPIYTMDQLLNEDSLLTIT